MKFIILIYKNKLSYFIYKLRSKLLIYYYNFLLKEFNKLYSWSNQMIQTNRNRYIKYKTKYNAK